MSEASPRDPVVLALGSAVAGAAFGGAATTAGIILFRLLQTDAGRMSGNAGFLMITAALLAGIGCAFAIARLLARRVPDSWRRGAVAIIAIFGTCLFAGAAAPADAVAGRTGLSIYLSLLLGTGFWSWSRARRAA